MSQPLTHVYADAEQFPDALRSLADALENGDAHAVRVETGESIGVDDHGHESLTLEYTLSEAFHGIDPIKYDNGHPGGPEATESEGGS